MTQQDKELLLKDLCARLPYGVRVKRIVYNPQIEGVELLGLFWLKEFFGGEVMLLPYLRPISSMTEGERYKAVDSVNCKFHELCMDGDIDVVGREYMFVEDMADYIDFLNAHHFDYHGLIEKGLAIEVTEENNPYKD